jgi:hypothetical protein
MSNNSNKIKLENLFGAAAGAGSVSSSSSTLNVSTFEAITFEDEEAETEMGTLLLCTIFVLRG